MKFAIRDDDISFFTTPEDLDAISHSLKGIPISLSVVPYTVSMHKSVYPYGEKQDNGIIEYDIANNKELILYLKEQIKQKKYEILLHGINHQYKEIDGAWISEMKWRSKNDLVINVRKAKEHLEGLFDCTIRTFAAPSNVIDKNGIQAIEESGLNFSGIIKFNDREINPLYIKNFLYRWAYRLFMGVQYGGVLTYKQHKELAVYPANSYERLVKEYQLCKKRNNPFIIYTHSWYLMQNKSNRELLERMVEYLLADGATPVLMSECFE